MGVETNVKLKPLPRAAEGGVAILAGFVGLPAGRRVGCEVVKSDWEYRVAVGHRRADRLSAQENRQS